MKRPPIIILILLIVLSMVFSSGFTHYKSIGSVSLLFDGKEVLNESISIDFNKFLEIKLFHKGDYFKYYRNGNKGSPIDYLGSLNRSLAQNIIELKNELDIAKVEPNCQYMGEGKFSYFQGVRGLDIDIEALALIIIKNFSGHNTISLPYKYVEVETTFTDLVSRTQNLSAFATSYHTSSSGRKNNVRVATERLNGAVIISGETLSFNEIVGERTENNGFSMAKIIQNGEFIEGVGGGVCQVSTTLFNACLLAGLEIERSATHSLPVSYVAPSLDAMVSSSSDLIVKNNTPYNVYIYGHCDGKKLTFEVFGYSNGYKVKLRSVKLRELFCDEYEIIALDTIPDGVEFDLVTEKEPVNGLVSESYRDYFSESGLVFTERLRRSIYAPQKGIKYKKIQVELD